MRPLVSIVIPCYNASRWLSDTIESCLEQTHRPLELIIVDDGSEDDSKKIADGLAKRSEIPIKAIESPHRGAGAARNLGLAAAKGPYVQFLDADDLMPAEKISTQLEAALRHPGCAACGPWVWLKKAGNAWVTAPPKPRGGRTEDFVREWLEGDWFVVHCFLWPREILAALNGWDESLASCQDADLYIRAALNGGRFIFVPGPPVLYRVGHNPHCVSAKRTWPVVRSRVGVLDGARAAIEARSQLAKYREALARRYYTLAADLAHDFPDEARKCFHQFMELSPDGRFPGTLANRLGVRLLGVVKKQKLSRTLRSFRKRLGSG